MTRVFSGIKPTGPVQLGNLLGALRHWVADQAEADTIFCVVDLHALTVPQDPTELRTRTLELAQLLLAIGIDPARSTLFVQSSMNSGLTSLGHLLTKKEIQKLQSQKISIKK